MSTQTDAFLGHPKVAQAISHVVRRNGMRRASEIEDAVADVQMAAWIWTKKERPTTVEGWRTVCRAIAHKIAVNEVRKKVRRAPHNVGLVGNADKHAPLPDEGTEDALDLRRALEELRLLHRRGELPPDVEKILEGLQDGMTLKEIAAAHDISYDYLRRQRSDAKLTVADHFQMVGLDMFEGARRNPAAVVTAVAAVALLFIFIRVKPPGPIAHGEVDAGTAPPIPTVPQPIVPDPKALAAAEAKKRAEELTQQAETAMKAEDWGACIDAVSDAYHTNAGDGARLGPLATLCRTGEENERQRMGKRKRKDAGNGIEAGAKAPK